MDFFWAGHPQANLKKVPFEILFRKLEREGCPWVSLIPHSFRISFCWEICLASPRQWEETEKQGISSVPHIRAAPSLKDAYFRVRVIPIPVSLLSGPQQASPG
jgi:hypothetical protein